MSKAFTREDDDAPEVRPPARRVSSLPPGVKNYLTPDGAQRLRDELDRLEQVERPRLTALPADDRIKRELQDLDSKMEQLRESLGTAAVVPPPPPPWDQVRFGATVTVREPGGTETRYRIVGPDETDLDRNWISSHSPIAKVLVNARLGQRVQIRLPSGPHQLEVTGITYE